MLNEIFSIDKFNIISDNDNYYFFRALNNFDNKDIETRKILDTNNNITRIRTDRERYIGETKYTNESIISLEEVNDHVKWSHTYDTNCISLTSNANAACMFGRKYYNDTYVIVKIPKEELNKSVFCSGLYLINEINKKIENMINNNELSISQVNYINRINNIDFKDELRLLKKELVQVGIEEPDYFNNGIEFKITNSKEFIGLSEEQELEKNKLILKLDIINKSIIPYFSNRRLIETVKLGFSASEFIHYKDIEGKKVKFINKELVDVWALIQQLPSNISFLDELKKELLYKTYNIEINGIFEYKDFNVSESNLTIENMFNITNGQVNYQKAIEMYEKSFYYAKSKLRALNSIELLKKLVDYNPKYNEIIEYLNIKAFGVEPKITTRFENNRVNLSEAVSLDFKPSEQLLFNYLEHQTIQSLNAIINYPNETLKRIVPNLVYDEDIIITNKEEYYANAIIDIFDWKKLGIERLYPERKNEIIEQLLKCDIVNIYNNLKNSGIKETQISNILLTNIIKVSIYMEDLKLNDKEYNDIFIKLINNRISNLNINETFTLEELEWFLGYNKVIDTDLNLFQYQRPIANNITKTLKQRRYTSAIIPTGTGKSYISLYELYLHKDEELLYVAPNKEILNQLKRIIIKVYNPEKHAGESNNDLVKKVFPNLTLTTYQDLQDKTEEEQIFKEYGFKEKVLKKEYQKKYDFIICDELHRTGAIGWQEYIEMLFSYQNESTKVLGVTATPERDRDDKDMSEYWARYFGYTDEEILKGMHQAVNMDIVEAIKKGIIANPKVINCEYSLISDGSMDDLKLSIQNIMDEDFKNEEMKKYEELRRNVENSDGIEKILHDNLEQDSKYIVFLPVTKKNDGTYEDEFGDKVDKSTAERVIKDYQVLMRQYLFSHNYLTNENNRVKELYNKIINNISLTNEELVYLTKEKKYILLLAKIDIQYKPSALNTETNIIADTIIKYMNWELLDVKIRNKRIKELTNNLVEYYSMLGSYNDAKNEKQLTEFNKKTKGKIKLMFVMNKLNEGVHADDVKGIIWLRPLDEQSRILYFQQLGRCIHSFKPGTTIEEKDRPVVLDLVNNTLKVKLNKDILKEKDDLNSLNNIINWIERNNNIIPNIDSINEVERINARVLRRIQRTYIKYIKDDSLLNNIKLENKILIEEIINKGIIIDLWNMNILLNNKNDKEEKNNNEEEILFNLFEIKPILRNFVDIVDEVNLYDSYKFDYYYSLLVKLKDQGEDVNLTSHDKLKMNDDGTISVIKKKTQRINGIRIHINIEEYDNVNLISIGSWLYKNQKNFTEEQKQKLRDIGYILSDEKEDLFERYYGYLIKLKDQGEDVNLTNQDKIRIDEDNTISVIKKKTQRINGRDIHINVEEYNDVNLISIGSWLYTNQKNFTEEQKQKLRDIGYVLSDEKEDLFERYYGYLIKLKDQGEDVNLTNKDKIRINEDNTISVIKKKTQRINGRNIQINVEEYNDVNLISIGSWLYTNQKNFTEEQKQKLRDIGYVLSGEEDLFERYYGYLIELKDQGEDVNLTNKDKIRINEDNTISVIKKKTQRINGRDIQINVEEYNDVNLISIGNWLYTNQKNFTEEQKQKLRDIGYYDNKFEQAFNYYYNLLVKLKDQGEYTNLTTSDKIRENKDGTISVVKKKTKIIDGKKIHINIEEYNDVNLILAGSWLYKNQEKFDEPQKQKLRNIGYYDEYDKNFDKSFNYYYNLLVKLKDQREYTNLSTKDKIRENKDGTLTVIKRTNKEEYNKENLISVGDWLYKNQEKFDEPQKQKLRDIGYYDNRFEQDFNYYYSLLVKLKDQGEYTNLRKDDKIRENKDGTIGVVKKETKRIDGKKIHINIEEYNDKKLILVGYWLYYNQNKFDETQKQKLRDIGYVLKEDKKNNKKQKQEEFDKDSSFGKKKDEILNKKEHQHGK